MTSLRLLLTPISLPPLFSSQFHSNINSNMSHEQAKDKQQTMVSKTPANTQKRQTQKAENNGYNPMPTHTHMFFSLYRHLSIHAACN